MTAALILPADGVPPIDIRLIAVDMDGTLLDERGEIHDHFWPLIDELHRRGILFCPASGRQYFTLLDRFADVADEMVFIAENGTYVVRQGREISSDCLTTADAGRVVRAVRQTALDGVDTGAVVCGKRSAYIDRSDPEFVDRVSQYMVRLGLVDDLIDAIATDDILKVSVFDFGSAAVTSAPPLAEFRTSHQVTVSHPNWIDITSPTASKGAAIRALQQAYAISPAQTLVFGDYLNDLEMMDTADWSFAMANAHPELAARARYQAPSNRENGVVRTISQLLDLDWH